MILKIGNDIIDVDDLDRSIIQRENGLFYIDHHGQKVQAHVARDKNKIFVGIQGKQFVFEELEDDFGGASVAEAQNEIKSPMPGSVVKIIVNEGDEVSEGSALIIVEAMKMETTLYSSMNGKIKSIHVKEKEQIDSDQILIEIE